MRVVEGQRVIFAAHQHLGGGKGTSFEITSSRRRKSSIPGKSYAVSRIVNVFNVEEGFTTAYVLLQNSKVE